MQISKSSIKRPVTTLMVVLIVVLLGVVSLMRLKLDLFPNIEMSYAIVSCTYVGAGPEEMESLVTKPLEAALGTTSGLKQIQSRSSNNSSMVILEFVDGTDMNQATLDMREKIDLMKNSLPDDASDPMVIKLNPSMMPALIYSVSSDSITDLVELNRVVEDKIQDRLERVDGVASVSIYGGRTKEVSVYIYPDKMKGFGVSVSQINSLLSSENLNLPIGTIKQGDADLIVRTIGEFTSIEDIRNLPITTSSGATIHLRDVADVNETLKDQTSYAYVNGNKAIAISVQKQSDANTVNVADLVNAEIDSIKAEMPDLEFYATLDQSVYIKQSLNNVVDSAYQGAFFAVIVLLLFLRNIPSTLVVATAIPLSIIATFMLMDFGGVTINMVSLGGLTLGIGMLVDNSIVVLENIFRHREMGKNRIEAAIDGAKEVSMAISASTLTTVAVFLPILFVEGIAGKMFKEMALTVSFSLLASIAVALTWVPMMSSKVLKLPKPLDPQKKKNIFRKIVDFWGGLLDKLDNGYRRFIKWAVWHKKIVCLIVLVAFVGSISLSSGMGMEFFPESDEGTISVSISMPKGTLLEETKTVTFECADRLEGIEEIESVVLNIGGGATSMLTGSSGDSSTITINLVDVLLRSRSANDLAEVVRQLYWDIPGAEISVTVSSSMSTSSSGSGDISIEVYGDNFEQLEEISNELKELIANIDGTREVTTSMEEGTPEAAIRIDRSKASLYGVTAAQVASALNTAVSGTVSTQYKYDDTEIDVRIRQEPTNLNYIVDIENILIQTPSGAAIPLKELATIENQKGPITISRINQKRYITISSAIYGRDLNSVTTDVTAAINDYQFPSGYRYEIGGMSKEMMDSFTALAMALLLAVVLVYMIMAAQFESLRYPFIILMTIPLALTGGALGLIAFGESLSIMGIIGMIMLAGIVVNNGIVLVDYINQLRAGGMKLFDAIIEAGPTRLRPILMTTLTTVLALVPMMLSAGSGSEMSKGLSIVVVFGLSISTLVTLVFVPVAYAILENLKAILMGILRIKPKQSSV